MLVRINKIQIKKRIRKDSGNINELVESMNTHGLMNPIVLTKEYQLVSGFRRLESAKKLGWEKIEANIIDAQSKVKILEMEIEENIHRKDFTPEEIVDAYTKLENLKNPCFFSRFLQRIKDLLKKIFHLKA